MSIIKSNNSNKHHRKLIKILFLCSMRWFLISSITRFRNYLLEIKSLNRQIYLMNSLYLNRLSLFKNFKDSSSMTNLPSTSEQIKFTNKKSSLKLNLKSISRSYSFTLKNQIQLGNKLSSQTRDFNLHLNSKQLT